MAKMNLAVNTNHYTEADTTVDIAITLPGLGLHLFGFKLPCFEFYLFLLSLLYFLLCNTSSSERLRYDI